jgi:hypothetical protein
MRVRFSELFKELIEVEVDLSPLPNVDNESKDITANFKMFNGFDPKGQLFTDSNGLEMQKRQL